MASFPPTTMYASCLTAVWRLVPSGSKSKKQSGARSGSKVPEPPPFSSTDPCCMVWPALQCSEPGRCLPILHRQHLGLYARMPLNQASLIVLTRLLVPLIKYFEEGGSVVCNCASFLISDGSRVVRLPHFLCGTQEFLRPPLCTVGSHSVWSPTPIVQRHLHHLDVPLSVDTQTNEQKKCPAPCRVRGRNRAVGLLGKAS